MNTDSKKGKAFPCRPTSFATRVIVIALVGVFLAPTATFAAATTTSTQKQVETITAQIKALQAQLDVLKGKAKACTSSIEVATSNRYVTINPGSKSQKGFSVTLKSCEEIEKKSITMSVSIPTAKGAKEVYVRELPLVWEKIEKKDGLWTTRVNPNVSAKYLSESGTTPKPGKRNITFSYGNASTTVGVLLKK